MAGFLPNFLPSQTAYFAAIGSYFSFVLVLICSIVLSFLIFIIEKHFNESLSFAGWWMVFQGLIDWIYLPLITINLRFFVLLLARGGELSASILELAIMCFVVASIVGYHILLANVSVGLSNQPSEHQLKSQKRKRISDFCRYMKSCALALILACIEGFGYEPLIYGFFVVFLAHFLLQLFFYDFVGTIEKVVMGITQLASAVNLILVVLRKDVVIIYGVLAAIFLMEMLICAFKLYCMLTKKSRPTVQVHPIRNLTSLQPCKELESPPHRSKEHDGSIINYVPNRYEQDSTELQLEIVMPRRQKFTRKRFNRNEASESIFDNSRN